MPRVSSPSPPGSLFKQREARRSFKPQGEGQRTPRIEDAAHLAAIRLLPCIVCGVEPCGEAAHVRMSSAAFGKKNPGVGQKPSDSWAVPLCHKDHMQQHSEGERDYWHSVGINPLQVATELYQVSPDVEAMRDIITRWRT